MTWKTQYSKQLYAIGSDASGEYWDINENGELIVNLNGRVINIRKIASEKRYPVMVLRILPFIRIMMDKVHRAFNDSINRYRYNGRFLPIYPLKSSTDDLVLDIVWKYGKKYNWGFNAGTKPEIWLIQKYAREDKRLLVVDGVKDHGLLRDLEVFINNQWEVVVDVEDERDAKLLTNNDFKGYSVGLRLKLLTRGAGVWASSSGIDSKFGLNINRFLDILDKYSIANRIKLLHVHIGSQIPTISVFEKAFKEASIIYNDLKELGLKNLRMIDFGGGLAYPYIGKGDGTDYSPDYDVEEYADLIVKTLKENTIDEPDIVFEGGRYIVSPHRIVLSKIVDVRPYSGYRKKQENISLIIEKIRNARNIKELNNVAREIRQILTRLEVKSYTMNLRQRSEYEDLVWRTEYEISKKARELAEENPLSLHLLTKAPNLVLELLAKPTHRVYLSFSIFSHLPDVVIVNQYFPATPIQRLNEQPEVIASISDLTCDTMGELQEFITRLPSNYDGPLFTSKDNKLLGIPGKTFKLKGIPIHIPRENEEYYIAFLHTGAYQDMLGMNHNMLDGAPEIIIDLDEKGELVIWERRLEASKNYIY